MAQLTEAYLKNLIKKVINEMAATPLSRSMRSASSATSDYKYGEGGAEDVFRAIADLEGLVSNSTEREQRQITKRIAHMIKILKDGGAGHTDDSIASEMPRYRK